MNFSTVLVTPVTMRNVIKVGIRIGDGVKAQSGAGGTPAYRELSASAVSWSNLPTICSATRLVML